MRMRYIELAVGAFMIMGVIALVLMALRVSGLSMQSTGDTYTLKAHFENLGGLKERAKVSMAGVNIGQVTKIYLDAERYSAVVEMEINKSMSTLSTDSSAAILTSGLLGEKYIGLTVGAEMEYLKQGDWIDDTQSALVLEELIGRLSGSTPIISMADNCSVAFIKPISAVNADPARPANNNAAITGPSSRNKVSDTKVPKAESEPNFTKMV